METIKSTTLGYYYRRPFYCYDNSGYIFTDDGNLALWVDDPALSRAITAALNGEAVEYHGKRINTRYYDEAQEICTSDGSMIADVRGWGMLKAADVPLSVAIFIQDEFGEAVSNIINNLYND